VKLNKVKFSIFGIIKDIYNTKPGIQGKVLESSIGGSTKIFKFFLRILIIISAIILAKSLFLCIYLDNFTLHNFDSYVYSLSSGLISIGVFTGNCMGYLLDKTPFNINFKEI